MCLNSSVLGSNISDPDCDVDLVPRWAEIGLTVYMLTTALLSIFGNGLIVIVEMKNLCKTSTDWLVFCMAANDISFALVNIPIYIMFYMGSWLYTGSDVGCGLHVFVEKTTIFSSTLLLCTVAVDRYCKTCRPHSRFLTPKRSFRTCIAITIVSVILTSPAFPVMKYDEKRFCVQIQHAGRIVIDGLHILFILTFVAMFIIVGFCYARIAYMIKCRLVKTLAVSKTIAVATCSSPPKKVSPSIWSKSSGRNKISPSPERNSYLDVPDNNQPSHLVQSCQQYSSSSSADQIADQCLSDQTTKRETNRTLMKVPSKQETAVTTHSKTNSFSMAEKSAANARTDRTTRIMFAVTLVFLLSWIPTWLMYIYGNMAKDKSTIGHILVLFGQYLFMINTFMNPFFYISMSSVFKQRTKKVLQTLFSCKRWRKRLGH